MKNKTIFWQSLGRISYKPAWDYQTLLFEKIIQQKTNPQNSEPTENYFLLCEHNHVYTLGKSGKIENLLISESQLAEKNIEFFKINRGGDITYHGLGQVVGYPILDLENFATDIHWYMRSLEEVIIRTLADFGIVSERLQGLTGVWVDIQRNPRKICAMGVKTSRWVTMHGFALNVNTQLDFFNYIVPCGIADKGVTSMQKELGKEIDLQEVEKTIIKHFGEVFEAQMFPHSLLQTQEKTL
ncbi:MAG: lipoyl(octanoyl) transferase LipB [Raineya sp.]|nr:lipoyl(octanoyl) transferase LipB [Raineya sp.]MDW8295729.1 lipoyl(octanoyl) transferase LipB [Raineya sp.]